jgi:hypothetical protein
MFPLDSIFVTVVLQAAFLMSFLGAGIPTCFPAPSAILESLDTGGPSFPPPIYTAGEVIRIL